jgi:tryptophan synthase alpha chain
MFVRGVERFVEEMARIGIRGAIVPDLPPEEGGTYIDCMRRQNLAPIFIFSPNTPVERMRTISEHGQGFVYCVARKGVTGKTTEFSRELGEYLTRCRQSTPLPIALGFGVRNRADLDYLRGKVDMAVVGSETLRIVDEQGVAGVAPFIRQLIV